MALIWAWAGTIDIVASATGKIVPSGRTKVIQPFETGVVRSIRVQDGQAVKAGDVLIELDPTVNAAERDHLHNDLLAEQLNIARLRAALAGGDNPSAGFTPPADADPALVSAQRQLLLNQVAEHRAKIAALARVSRRKRKPSRARSRPRSISWRRRFPVIQQRVDIRKTLMEKELGSKLTYFEILQALVEQQEDLGVQKSHLREAEAAAAAILETRGQAEAEYRHALSDDLTKAEQKASGLAQDLIKAEQKTKLQLLTAPVDGVVQQLAIHTVGGVVTPAQSLLMVVPSDSRLEIEAMVSNRDIGFVHAGQEAEIKIDTFNFTRYGLLHGQVLSVSQDAVIRDRKQDRPDNRGLGAQNELQRAARPGAELHRAHFARPHADADRRPDGQSVARHGGDGGNQDRITHDPELSLVTAAPLPAGDIARAVSRRRISETSKSERSGSAAHATKLCCCSLKGRLRAAFLLCGRYAPGGAGVWRAAA